MKKKWLKMYEMAFNYYMKHGDLKISRKYITEDGYKLGMWVHTQRIAYRNRFLSSEERTNNFLPLTDEQVDLLEKIGMIWKPNAKMDLWMEMYNEAKKYYEEHGSLLIINDEKIKNWIKHQRRLYINKTLTDKQIELLESIGMVWDFNINDVLWNRMYELARNYYLEYGTLLTINDKKLYTWIHHQRQAYKNRFKEKSEIKNTFLPLTDEQVTLLEGIGMIWDFNTYDSRWRACFECARAYYIKHGDLNLPSDYKSTNGKYVYNWIDEQILLLEQGLLSSEKVDLLESIGIKKEIYDWNEYYKEACIYFKVHRNLDIPRKYKTHNGLKLGLWIVDQRKKYKDLKLTEEQIKKLEDIRMLWDGIRDKEELWNEYFFMAKDYFDKNKNLYINDLIASKEEIRLNRWLKKQRKAYDARVNLDEFSKIEPLTDEQVELLESIGMEWSIDTKVGKWNKCFEMARDYYNLNGNLNMPVTYKSLFGKSISKWLKVQIKELNQGRLKKDQEEKLESIGIKKEIFDWNEYYIEAVKYYKLNGNLNVPKKYITVDGKMLGTWIYNLRKIYKNALLKEEKQNKSLLLSMEQIKLLESIGMIWETKKKKEEIWNEFYYKAKDYYKKNGSLEVCEYSKLKEERDLSKWLKKQNKLYENRCIPNEFINGKIDILTDEQVRLLKSIGMKFDNTFEIQKLECLRNYIIENKDCFINSVSYEEKPFTKVKK